MGYIDNWREGYYDPANDLHTDGVFLSPIGTGSQKRTNPGVIRNLGWVHVLSGGRYFVSFSSKIRYIIGQGIDQTFVSIHGKELGIPHVTNLTITGCSGLFATSYRVVSSRVLISLLSNDIIINKSLICANQPNFRGSNNSILGLKEANRAFIGSNNLLDRCVVDLTNFDFKGKLNDFVAFNDCTFKIGDKEWMLEGHDEVSYREDFVNKCEDAGVTLPLLYKTPMANWIFANGSTIDGTIIDDSIIGQFQKRRFPVKQEIEAESDKLVCLSCILAYR